MNSKQVDNKDRCGPLWLQLACPYLFNVFLSEGLFIEHQKCTKLVYLKQNKTYHEMLLILF